MSFLDRLVTSPLGALSVLALAAILEAWGDSFFQSAFYRASGFALYGSVVNIPRWDFGRLIGAYVVLFFLLAQVIARLRFAQPPAPSIYVGGSLITVGGLIIALWK